MANKKLQLSDELDYIFESGALNYAVDEVAKKYSLDKELLLDFVYDTCDNYFYFDDFEDQLSYLFPSLGDKSDYAAKEILSKIFLPISVVLDNKSIDGELKKREIDGRQYQNYIDICRFGLENHAVSKVDRFLDGYQKKLDKTDEADSAKELFTHDLADILKIGESPNIASLNLNLIYQLKSKPGLKEELLRIIAQNQETLTSQPFKLEGRTAPATIENWIKDFTIRISTNILDSIALSSYMSSSVNVAVLDGKERKLVSRLFLFYRNIKGFPEFFANMPIEQWQIFPLEMKAVEERPILRPSVQPNPLPNFPFTKEQMKNMTGIEKMVAMQEHGISEEEWRRLVG